MTIGMRWFPHRKGMAMGVVVGGFGGGAFVFNQIQVRKIAVQVLMNVYVNPNSHCLLFIHNHNNE